MAENKLKMRIYRIFRSCKSKYQITNDVVEASHHHYQLIEDCPIFSPQKLPLQSNNSKSSYYSYSYQLTNSKIPNFNDEITQLDGRKCPPVSPIISPLNINNNNTAANFYNPQFFNSSNPNNKHRRSKTHSTKYNRDCAALLPSEIESSQYYGGNRRKSGKSAPIRRKSPEIDGDLMSLAVVKRSRDPYADFRASMVEMIVENQIFGDNDLRNLLRCFLSLNSCHYHGLILQVFDDISQSLLRVRRK